MFTKLKTYSEGAVVMQASSTENLPYTDEEIMEILLRYSLGETSTDSGKSQREKKTT